MTTDGLPHNANLSAEPERVEGGSKSERQLLRVLVTGCGARGLAVGTMRWLRKSRSFDTYLVGVDAAINAVGQYTADLFRVVPRADHPSYAVAIERIVQSEQIDVVLPLLDNELLPLADLRERRGINVAAPSRSTIKLCTDKALLLDRLHRAGLNPSPAYVVSSAEKAIEMARNIGYPAQHLIAKPRRGSGARGVWVISEESDAIQGPHTRSFMHPATLERFCSHAANRLSDFVFAPLAVGDHYTVSCLNMKGTLSVVPIRRDSFEPGITWSGEVVRNQQIIDHVGRIVRSFNISPCANVQLVWDGQQSVIYEINPRLSTTSTVCAAAGINLADALLHRASGIPYIPGEVRWGLRFSRYAADLVDVE